MFYHELNDLYLNQLLNDFEADLSEGGHQRLLDKFMDIRKEIEDYQNTATEELENLDDMLTEIKDILE